MIIFEFDTDTGDSRQVIYWFGCTSITKEDKQHTDEIYEQLDAELAFNL